MALLGRDVPAPGWRAGIGPAPRPLLGSPSLTQSLIATGHEGFDAGGITVCARLNVGLDLSLIPSEGASGAASAALLAVAVPVSLGEALSPWPLWRPLLAMRALRR